MNNSYDYLPQHWIDWLKKFAETKDDGRDSHLTCDDFCDSVTINFNDGTFLYFQHAFFALNEKEIAVFTENFGHHVFPLHDDMIYTCQKNCC